MSKKVLYCVANGSEEMEFSAPVDILRRSQCEVLIAKVPDKNDKPDDLICKLANGVKVIADIEIEKALSMEFDMIVCPGGMPGSQTLGEYKPLIEKLKKQKVAKKWYCAICAAPYLVFGANHLIDDEFATSYPSYQEKLPKKDKIKEKVVISNNCITSQGPGTAMEFGYTLAEALVGKNQVDNLRKGMVYLL